MTLRKKLFASGLATLAVIATTMAASAAPAVATGNVNVRTGPGTGYRVVDTLRRGEPVNVQQCRGSWCYVEKRGPDGWVSANYLSTGRPHWDDRWDNDWDNGWDNGWERPRPPRPPHWNPRPRPQPTYPGHSGGSVCFNGPNGYFCIGN
ncbi:SH3 domain-containing protein [Devosia sp. XJ19-1]|uniref:SH3 domain-containing protein n=1 Tax=Devosia ureilytica TaxID=2952754 RepID=A0A9Q4APS0_9HYPH|nr:SH3 domain-containing protein [Devosia ureilytica]MCP8883883.1 SH3 domain-containing protein [Devosia ureilytica]MCP8887491.1 SH3 domain-containing protein [Devosia ureilytica]